MWSSQVEMRSELSNSLKQDSEVQRKFMVLTLSWCARVCAYVPSVSLWLWVAEDLIEGKENHFLTERKRKATRHKLSTPPRCLNYSLTCFPFRPQEWEEKINPHTRSVSLTHTQSVPARCPVPPSPCPSLRAPQLLPSQSCT